MPGKQSEPGLIIFRYDADLFYANASQFVDEVQGLVDKAPDKVRWLILDCAGISDIDYSAAQNLASLLDWLEARGTVLVLARPEPDILTGLERYGLRERFPESAVFDDLDVAVRAFPRGIPHALTLRRRMPRSAPDGRAWGARRRVRGRRTGCRAIRAAAWSSQRSSASAEKTIASATSDRARSSGPGSSVVLERGSAAPRGAPPTPRAGCG